MTPGGSAGAGKRVDFVIGGAQKCGTTALATVLQEHPGVAVAAGKEAHWFDNDRRYAEGVPDPARYHALFGDPSEPRLWCDATPTYWWWPPAPARIRDYNPGMKWIVLLRDPVARAYSHWNMERTRGRETLGFREALAAEDGRMRNATMHEARAYTYLSRGFYARQLERLWSVFPRDRTLVLRSDRLRAEFPDTVREVVGFLGLPPMDVPDAPPENTGSYEQPLAAADRADIVRVYESDVRALERMLGWNLSEWLR
ncbi:hypothetical protein BURK1_03496 [Burkholderiales bacterium]|nr:hypothetical protein BURK1_03496 [Burkholderiales bacterium]